MMSEDIVNLDNVIVDLYRIIDNIDTFCDMTKGDYEAFYKATMKEVEKSKKHLRIFEHILRNMEPVHD